MELYYINSKNEKIDFMSSTYLARNIEELLDYDWEYKVDDQSILGFSRGVCEIPMTINVLADSEEEYFQASNRLFEVAEYDVLNNVRGKLWLNGQYVLCNLISSKKEDWCMDIDFHLAYLRLVTEYPFWVTEQKYEFKPIAKEQQTEEYLDFPFDMPFDLKGDESGTGSINLDHYAPCDFLMTIYGPCLNPRIIIGGNLYEVKTKLDAGEYLLIGSRNGTVYRVRTNGVFVDEFDNRNSQTGSVFEKIKPGYNMVSWDGSFGFDMLIYLERSEPLWKASSPLRMRPGRN